MAKLPGRRFLEAYAIAVVGEEGEESRALAREMMTFLIANPTWRGRSLTDVRRQVEWKKENR